jgi:uncharacterized protein
MRRTVLTALAAMTALAGFWLSPTWAQTARDGKIRILGRASIEVVPDQVIVRVGISNRAASPTAALDQNSAIARRIVEFSKTFGADERSVRTETINLAPAFKSVRDPNGTVRQEPDGYAATNTVRVRFDDVSRLGGFMREILEQGATNIGGVQFGVSQREKFVDEARSKAVEDAVRQARLLAQATGTKLGPIHEIVHPPRTQFSRTLSLESAAAPRGANLAVPVEAGVVEIVAEVEVTWSIE